MSYDELIPMLRTKDFEATIQFYVNVLAFVCEVMDEETGWALLKKDAVTIMLAKPNDHTPFEEPAFTGSLYIKTKNIDAVWKRGKDKATVCYPVEDFEYGMREFSIYDNNGYLVQFGQEIS